MPSPKHIAAGSLFTVILIVLGFALGLWANSHLSIPSFSPSEDPPPVKPNNNTYQVSSPNKGRVNFTVSFPMTVTGTGSFVMLPEDKAKGIEEGQYVLLYDEKNNMLPIVGTITSVTKGSGVTEKNIALRIHVEDGPDVPTNKVAKGAIITDTIKYAQRLPLTALVYHNDESAHVWEVTRESDGRRLTKLRTLPTSPIIVGEFFILVEGEYISNVYILNPNEELQDEQSINVTDVLYQAPHVPNPQTIAEQKAEWVFDLPDRSPPGAGCSTSCGSDTGAADYIEKIKALAREQADKLKNTP